MKYHRDRAGKCGSGSGLVIGAIILCCFFWLRDQPGEMVVFAGRDVRGGEEFTGTEATTVFGGYKLDLRDAHMPKGRAVLDVTTIFGGTQIIVPDDWNVVVEGHAIFGGFEDKTRHPAESADELIVRGYTVFGGVQIRN